MFGYIVVNKPELKIKDFDTYRSFYCGLCQTLHKQSGRLGQISLNYDLAFLAILLSGLYEPTQERKHIRCFMHPVHKREIILDPYMQYAADMTIVLTYLKCDDDWKDERSVTRHMYQKLLQKRYDAIKMQYPDKIERIVSALEAIHVCEQQQITDLDQLSSLFGKVMAEVVCLKKDEWHDTLYRMGDYLGRFIYIMDAYDDIENDVKQQQFNPFMHSYTKDGFDKRVKDILELMMVHCSEAFEVLPILTYQDILRNILYSGVWGKFEMTRKKRLGEHDE